MVFHNLKLFPVLLYLTSMKVRPNSSYTSTNSSCSRSCTLMAKAAFRVYHVISIFIEIYETQY